MSITRTNMIDDDGSGTTGTIINNAWKQEFYNQIDALINPSLANWTPYTPAWKTTGGTQPVIGNGALAGRYIVDGHTIHFVLGMACGSSTTYGAAGIYSWSLPPLVPATIAGLTGFNFTATLLFTGGSAQAPVATFSLGGFDCYLITAAGGAVGPTIPFTWASGCSLMMRGTYDV